MIAFQCKKCGNVFERPDSAGGMVIFCDCGEFNEVPYQGNPARAATYAPAYAPTVVMPSPAIATVDPSHCFNHPETPLQEACSACEVPFCADCLVKLHGKPMCGPCKNYHLRSRQRGPSVSVMAVMASLVALVGIPISFTLVGIGVMFLGNSRQVTWTLVVWLVSLLPPAVAFIMGMVALRAVEEAPGRLSGRAWAITGCVLAGVTAVAAFEMALLAAFQP